MSFVDGDWRDYKMINKFDGILPFYCLRCGAGTKRQPFCESCQNDVDELHINRKESLKQREQRIRYQRSMGIRE